MVYVIAKNRKKLLQLDYTVYALKKKLATQLSKCFPQKTQTNLVSFSYDLIWRNQIAIENKHIVARIYEQIQAQSWVCCKHLVVIKPKQNDHQLQ